MEDKERPDRDNVEPDRASDDAARKTEAGAVSAPGTLGRDMLDAFGGGLTEPNFGDQGSDDLLADNRGGRQPSR